jgi:hypothetical protein
VAEKLGRRPSRAEYVREGRYSAGALTVRFGSWSGIGKNPSTTKDTKEHGGKTRISRELTRKTGTRQISKEANHKGHEEPQRGSGGWAQSARAVKPDEFLLHNFQRVPLAAVPAPLVGMRKVTESVAQMVVNTLLAPGNWQLAISQNQKQNPFTTEVTEEHGGTPIKRANEIADLQIGTRNGREEFFPLRPSASSVVKKDRPVMGEPFDRSPMTNAPVNELGVMVLFGMVAAGLGLQVESVQGKFPDCVANRQVAPGKWQYLRIEFEYESKNFKLHGHDPKGCDMIVCWKHNWKECPAEIEVVELCRLFGM